MRSRLILPLQIAILLLVSVGTDALARNVYVNGKWMIESQLRALDELTCTKVPDGRYWVDPRTGQWGFQGGGPEGFIGDHCRSHRPNLYDPRLMRRPYWERP